MLELCQCIAGAVVAGIVVVDGIVGIAGDDKQVGTVVVGGSDGGDWVVADCDEDVPCGVQ